MTFHLRKHKLSEFEPEAQDLIGCINGWKTYSWCSAANANSSELLLRLKDMDVIDAAHLLRGMAKLIKIACMGKALQDVYDEKKCHEAFVYIRPSNGQEQKVYRIWPAGNVRIYFCYGEEKSIVVFYGLAKRKDKLTAGEKSALQTVCEQFLVCQEQDQLNIMERK